MWYSDESESHSVVFDSLWPHGLYTPGNSPGQNTGVGSLYFLQGIFLTQGSNPGLLHCRQILYQLSHQGSPWYRDKRVLGFKTDLSIFGCLSLIQKWDFPCLRRSCTSAWIVYVRSQWTTAYCLFCFFFYISFIGIQLHPFIYVWSTSAFTLTPGLSPCNMAHKAEKICQPWWHLSNIKYCEKV